MKNPILLLASMSLSACASMAPFSYQEHCAVQGMAFVGVTQTSGSAFTTANAYNYQTGQSASGYGVTNYSGHSVSCGPPANDSDKCEVDRLQRVAQPKAEYNEGINGKRMVTGIGYVLYIVPGIIAKVAYDSSLDKAMKESQKLDSDLPKCSREPASVAPASVK